MNILCSKSVSIFLNIFVFLLKCDQFIRPFCFLSCLFKTVLEQSLLLRHVQSVFVFHSFIITLFLLCLSRTYTDNYSYYIYKRDLFVAFFVVVIVVGYLLHAHIYTHGLFLFRLL
jgi:hypothetical protein